MLMILKIVTFATQNLCILQNKTCKFGVFCSFEHSLENLEVGAQKDLNDEIFYLRDHCDFKTKTDKGIKVNIGRVHSIKCKTCDEKFTSKERLERHIKVKSLMDNLCETGNEELGLELYKHRSDELCLAVFSNTAVRDDGLPLLYLPWWRR